MRALTLRQPWATLVAMGTKKVETRAWRTDYRGPLAIHAAAQLRNPAHGERDQPFTVGRWRILPTIARMQGDDGERFDLLTGCVVATCKLSDVVPMLSETDRPPAGPYVLLDNTGSAVLRRYRGRNVDLASQVPYGHYAPGRYAWLLADITPLAPPAVPPPGYHQGLWTWDPATPPPCATTAA